MRLGPIEHYFHCRLLDNLQEPMLEAPIAHLALAALSLRRRRFP